MQETATLSELVDQILSVNRKKHQQRAAA